MIAILKILPKKLDDQKLKIVNCGNEKGDVRENKIKSHLKGRLHVTEVDF